MIIPPVTMPSPRPKGGRTPSMLEQETGIGGSSGWGRGEYLASFNVERAIIVSILCILIVIRVGASDGPMA